ncbi:MAG TPA: DUF4199 domain-containing protein [Bacteroidia bacterium]|nr:DUF4199 domain-containing protein [Bacteroidia bacterium]
MKKSSVVIMWGLITAIVTCLYSFAMYRAGNMSSPLRYINALLVFGGLLVGMLQFRNKVNGGFGTFGQLYSVGMLITVVLAIVSTLYFVILITSSPAFMEEVKAEGQAAIINMHMPDDQTEIAIKWNEKMTTPAIMIVGSVVGNLIMGALLGLLAAAISAKKKPFMEEDNNPVQS